MSKESAVYEKILQHVLDTFRNIGYGDFCAAIPSHRQPGHIQGLKSTQIPDLTCRKNDVNRTEVILDVETCESVFEESKTERWTLFIDFCRKTSAEFHVAIPAVCELSDGRILSGKELLASRFRELSIDTKGIKIWTVDVSSGECTLK